MSVTNVFPSHDQLDKMNEHLAQLCINTGGLRRVVNWRDLRELVRQGNIGEYFEVGDTFPLNKATGATATVSGLTSATVSLPAFIRAVDSAAPKSYDFTYSGAAWHLDNRTVALSAYGITPTGTPTDGAHIVVTVTAKAWDCDILDMDYDTPVEDSHKHSLSMAIHDCFTYGSIPLCPRQAIFSVATELEAGAYYFHCTDQPWFAGDKGKDIQFTLENAVPVGSQFVLGNSHNTTMIGATLMVYSGPTATTESQTAVMSEGNNGTFLGNLTSAGDPTNHLNSIQRALFGSNRQKNSAMRQYFNSDAAGAASGAVASWWVAQTEWDRPVVSTMPGFLYGIEPAFLDAIGRVKKRTALNTLSDGGGFEDTEELIFLMSRTEVYGQANNNVYETSWGIDNTLKTVPYAFYNGATSADHIKRENGTTARYWFLRSAYPTYANLTYLVGTDGTLYSNNANNSSGGAPAWAIH